MWTSLLAAIAAIPKLISSIESLIAYFQKAEENAWFADKDQAIADLKKASTPEEKLAAADKIQKAFKNL